MVQLTGLVLECNENFKYSRSSFSLSSNNLLNLLIPHFTVRPDRVHITVVASSPTINSFNPRTHNQFAADP